MNEELQKAQVWGMIVGIIIMALVGGSFRTSITVNNTVPPNASLIAFKETWTARHWLGGLVKTDQRNLNDIVSKYEGKKRNIANATITTKFTAIDSLCAIFTIFIYTPNTVEVEGRIIQ